MVKYKHQQPRPYEQWRENMLGLLYAYIIVDRLHILVVEVLIL